MSGEASVGLVVSGEASVGLVVSGEASVGLAVSGEASGMEVVSVDVKHHVYLCQGNHEQSFSVRPCLL